MNNLVMVDKGGIYVDSVTVARKFGMKHAYFVDNIKKVLSDYPDLTVGATDPKQVEKYYLEDRNYRGKDFKAYVMNREFFSLVAMRMTSKKAREWQRRFNTAFYEMEKRILQSDTNKADLEWTQTRLIGKTARTEETEIIKQFVDYATSQGSKSAKFYYKHITSATYKALGLMAQKEPKLRDAMNIYEISELMLAERLAARKIKEYMDLGRNYKDIYASVKSDLLSFAESLQLN